MGTPVSATVDAETLGAPAWLRFVKRALIEVEAAHPYHSFVRDVGDLEICIGELPIRLSCQENWARRPRRHGLGLILLPVVYEVELGSGNRTLTARPAGAGWAGAYGWAGAGGAGGVLDTCKG